MIERDDAVKSAIEAAGGVGKLAELLGISGPAISQWERIPLDRVIDVERVTGISRTKLRPDMFETADGAAA